MKHIFVIHSICSLILLIFTANLSAQSEWQLQKDVDGIKVWTRDIESQELKAFKVRANLQFSRSEVEEVVSDIYNVEDYYHMIKGSEDVQKITEDEYQYYLVWDFPWPVTDRFALVRSSREHFPDKTLIKTKYLPNGTPRKGLIMADGIQGDWVLQDIDEQSCIVEHVGFMDPGGSLPAWLANSSVVDVPYKTIQNLIKTLTNK